MVEITWERFERGDMNSAEFCEALKSLSQLQLYDAMQCAVSGKEFRAIHKELKKYGSGCCLHDRYPDAPGYIALAVSGVALVAAVVKMLLPLVT